MSPRLQSVVHWAPRAIGIATTLFLSLFALDAFESTSFLAGLRDFAVHLVPAALLAIVVAIAWRLPWVGAFVFGGLGALYATNVSSHPDWVLVISGPLFVTAALYATSAVVRTMHQAPRPRIH